MKTDTTDTGNVEAEPDTVNAVDDTDNGNSDEDNAKSDGEALQENAESDDKAQESTEADNETSQENADDDLPEGFEIEDHYETVEKSRQKLEANMLLQQKTFRKILTSLRICLLKK